MLSECCWLSIYRIERGGETESRIVKSTQDSNATNNAVRRFRQVINETSMVAAII